MAWRLTGCFKRTLNEKNRQNQPTATHSSRISKSPESKPTHTNTYLGQTNFISELKSRKYKSTVIKHRKCTLHKLKDLHTTARPDTSAVRRSDEIYGDA